MTRLSNGLAPEQLQRAAVVSTALHTSIETCLHPYSLVGHCSPTILITTPPCLHSHSHCELRPMTTNLLPPNLFLNLSLSLSSEKQQVFGLQKTSATLHSINECQRGSFAIQLPISNLLTKSPRLIAFLRFLNTILAGNFNSPSPQIHI